MEAVTTADTIPAPVDAPRLIAVREAVRGVRAEIAAAAERAGREANSVCLIGVTKTVDASGARCLYEAGVTDLGENRVAEGAAKADALGDGPTWHCIGHLQRNKIRRALGAFSVVHAVDSARLLEAIDRIAGELEVRPRCLVQVNVADEPQKHGLAPDGVAEVIAQAAECENIACVGLMTIAPLLLPGADPESSRRHFAALRALRDATAASTGLALPELSMGMSQDFAIAVEEGATLLRVGTALTASLRAA